MKILQILPYAELGGTEKVVSVLSSELQKQGHFITVLIPKGPALDLFKGQEIVKLPHSFLARRKKISECAADCDLIHIHAARELVKDYGKPVIFTPHSYYNNLDKLSVRIFSGYDAVICFTEWEKQSLQNLGVKKTFVIPNGIAPPPIFALDTSRNTGCCRIGYMGRLTKDKGLDLLIDELGKVEVPYELIVAGKGKEKENFINQAKRLDLPVSFVGYQETYSFLQTIDILALPSRTETFGLALVEAFSQAVPVVAADVCGLKEIVEDAGFVVPPNEFAPALQKLAEDGDLRKKMGQRARKRYERYYTAEKMAIETEKVYRLLADKNLMK